MPGAVVSKVGDELREGGARLAGELDAGGLDEACAAAAEPMRAMIRSHLMRLSPCGRLQRDPAGLDQAGRGLRHDGHPAGVAGGNRAVTLASLARREIGVAVDQGDDVALGRVGDQAEGVLDAGVAAAEDEDVLVDVGGRIVQLVLHVGQVAARAAHQVGVALGADGQDDGLGPDRCRRWSARS